MDDINLHYRFLNWRRRIREIREVRAVRYRDRWRNMFREGDLLRYHGDSDEVGCFVAARPLSKKRRYFEVRTECCFLFYGCSPVLVVQQDEHCENAVLALLTM
ncbi:SPRY domain-containing protein 3 [Xenoophorus captivus]|uniref:SPRY domain-containing protein 3 n=1 Tax=Xenoophorus captivus TaxID=1517983 RepID=A0ABV0R2C2_9TELE